MKEIERKFLVTSDAYKRGAAPVDLRQGYLCADPERTVRIRAAGVATTLTIKGLTVGATRSEFDYAIPADDAGALFALCLPPLIEKTRYHVRFGAHLWEVDEFRGENQGLVIAEVELASEDEAFELPPWIGREVTGDARYYNSNLLAAPFSRWR
jgi:adenylate cyclase